MSHDGHISISSLHCLECESAGRLGIIPKFDEGMFGTVAFDHLIPNAHHFLRLTNQPTVRSAAWYQAFDFNP